MIDLNAFANCSCGRDHDVPLPAIRRGRGLLGRVPELVRPDWLGHVYLLADVNTYEAAGRDVEAALRQAGSLVTTYRYAAPPRPDELALDLAVRHAPASASSLIVCGSGTLNDIGKAVATHCCLPYVLVATAASMDGFCSASASMIRQGIKVSLPVKAAEIVIGDIGVFAAAPKRLLQAGIGDMAAKAVSLVEWKFAHLINGEYYCPRLAALTKRALDRTLDAAEALTAGDLAAFGVLFDSLIEAGLAMNLAGVSRPASGVEHYFSHAWDMHAVAAGRPSDLHGRQCGVGTLLAIDLYRELTALKPDRAKAFDYVGRFDLARWQEQLRAYWGKAVDGLIALEREEGKYDRSKHAERFDRIEAVWPDIVALVETELPERAVIERALAHVGAPRLVSALDVDETKLRTAFLATKDIRDKYNVTRLFFDLGVIDEIADRHFGAG